MSTIVPVTLLSLCMGQSSDRLEVGRTEALASAKGFLAKVDRRFESEPRLLDSPFSYSFSDGHVTVTVTKKTGWIHSYHDYEREKEWWYGRRPKSKANPIKTPQQARLRLQSWQTKLGLPKEARLDQVGLRGASQGHENSMATARGMFRPYAFGFPYSRGSWAMILDTYDGQLVEFIASPTPQWKVAKPKLGIEPYEARATALKRIRNELKATGVVDGFAVMEPSLCWDLPGATATQARLVYRFEWREKSGGMVLIDAETGAVTRFVLRKPRR